MVADLRAIAPTDWPGRPPDPPVAGGLGHATSPTGSSSPRPSPPARTPSCSSRPGAPVRSPSPSTTSRWSTTCSPAPPPSTPEPFGPSASREGRAAPLQPRAGPTDGNHGGLAPPAGLGGALPPDLATLRGETACSRPTSAFWRLISGPGAGNQAPERRAATAGGISGRQNGRDRPRRPLGRTPRPRSCLVLGFPRARAPAPVNRARG